MESKSNLALLLGGASLITMAFALMRVWLHLSLFFVGCALLTSGLTRIISSASWSPLALSEYAQWHVGYLLLWACFGTYVLLQSFGPVANWIVIALMAGCVGTVLYRLPLALASAVCVRSLRTDIETGRPPRLYVPHVMISCSGLHTAGLLRRLIPRLARNIRQLADAGPIGLSAAVAPERLKSPEPLRRGDGGLGRAIINTLLPAALVSPAELRRLSDATRRHVVGSAAACLHVEAPGHASALVRYNGGDDLRIDSSVSRHFHGCRGPAVLMLSSQFAVGTEIDETTLGGYTIIRDRTPTPSTASFSRILANIAFPTIESDRRLSPLHRQASADLATVGIAPLADAYLRFRLSSSGTERFLHLMDSLEVMIKMSVFALTAVRREADSAESRRTVTAALSNPSLGIWCRVLADLVDDWKSSPVEVTASIVDHWRRPLAGAPLELVDAANGVGLSPDGFTPRSCANLLQWLHWFTWLRNNTRGHGSVSEEAAGSIWHPFHEVVLDVAAGLRTLCLEGSLAVADRYGHPMEARGWLRAGCRASTIDRDPDELDAQATRPVLRLGGHESPLAPFVRFERNVCWVWNRHPQANGPADFIDYASGRIQRFEPAITGGAVSGIA